MCDFFSRYFSFQKSCVAPDRYSFEQNHESRIIQDYAVLFDQITSKTILKNISHPNKHLHCSVWKFSPFYSRIFLHYISPTWCGDRFTIVRVTCRTIYCCTCRFGKHNYFPCHFIYVEGLSYGLVFIMVSKHRTDIISNNISVCHRGRIQCHYATVWFIRTPCIKFRYMISLYEFTVFLIATIIHYFRNRYLNRITNTVRCRYNAVNFLQNYHNRHRTARPWGRGMGCLLWVWILIYVLLLSSQRRM